MQRHSPWFMRFLGGVVAVLGAVIVFFLIAFWILFNCMYSTGSDRLAYELLNFKVTAFIPHIYYSSAELDQIRTTYAAQAGITTGSSSDTLAVSADPTQEPSLAVEGGDATARPSSGRRGESVDWQDGIAIVQHPVETPTPAPSEDESSSVSAAVTAAPAASGTLTNPATFVTVARFTSAKGANIILRSRGSFDGAQCGSVAPGEWCTVLSSKGQFPEIRYNGMTCYVYKDMLDMITVPSLPATGKVEAASTSVNILAY